MRTEGIKHSKSSWPKVIARKWLNIKSSTDEVHSINGMSGERRKSCSDGNPYVVVPEEFPSKRTEIQVAEEHDNIGRVTLEPEFTVETNPLKLRMFVGTWNVGGKPPDQDLKLSHWLRTPAPVDIYVIGFQEIVPLNAGNVLGTEDTSSAAKWLSLIHQTLNTQSFDSQLPDYKNGYPTNPLVPLSPQKDQLKQQILKPRVSFSDLLSLDDGDFLIRCLCLNPNSSWNSSNTYGNYGSPTSMSSMRHISRIQDQFSLVASKQMVGLFLCVWVHSDLSGHISNVKASCVGRGIMGYLGNKGSISISLTLCRTTFCFICTHLASGEKEGDEVKRNVDVAEILKKTKFSHSCRGPGEPLPPDTIMGHDKVIWLGDLNYRLTSTCGDTNELIKNNDWQALLEKDQLKIEQRAGRVFKEWNEGRIFFAPTYKYVADSDDYVVQTSMPKEKRRIPAWCDRILWKGDGLKQICYVRGESKFSDHRPVNSLFSVDVNAPKSITTLSSPTCEPKIHAGEFTLLSRKTQSCIESIPRFSVTTPKVTTHQ